MSAVKKIAEDKIDKLRQQIDSLDEDLIALLKKRSHLVEKVGKEKHADTSKKGKESIIRPGREAQMIRRILEKDAGLFPKKALAELWRVIISGSIHIEETPNISVYTSQENSECFWMAREYFGSFTQIARRSTTQETFHDIERGEATIAVLPVWDELSPEPWWVRAGAPSVKKAREPHVFARLPFLRLAPSKKSVILAVGFVEPEPTGDDRSLWVIQAPEALGFDAVQSLLHDQTGLKVVLLHHCRIGDLRHYLIELNDFVAKNDARMTEFVAKQKKLHAKNPPAAHFLGAYAAPIEF